VTTQTGVLLLIVLLTGCKPASRKPADAPLPILPPVVVTAPPVPVAPPGGFSLRLAAGTPITVSLGSLVDSAVTRPGFIGGKVTDEVKGVEGRTAIPTGSPVTIYVRTSKRTGPISEVRMGLYAVNVAGHEYSLSTGAREPAGTIALNCEKLDVL
jgi:hypothetical protein